MAVYFLHNWLFRAKLDTAWRTDVVESSTSQAEERRGLVDRPRRVVTVGWRGMTRSESHDLLFHLMRLGNETLQVPLYSDAAITTAPSSGTTINVVSDNRRFYTGQPLVVFEMDANGRPSNAQVRTINTVGASTITITSSLSGTVPAEAFVAPLLTLIIMLEGSAAVLTDYHFESGLALNENPENALPAASDYASLSAIYGTATAKNGHDYYVFNPEHDWSIPLQVGYSRAGREEAMGRGIMVETSGPRPLLNWELAINLQNRSEFFDLLKFFDGHSGRLVPFLMVNPQTLWELDAISTGYVDVSAEGELTDPQSFAEYVAIEMIDGTVHVREIDSVALQFGAWRITPTSAFPSLSAADIRRVTSAHFVRFDTDLMSEEWHTAEYTNISMRVREIVAEDEALYA